MYPTENPSKVSYFINRDNYIRNFNNMLQSGQHIEVIGDTYGSYGMGKTTMLSYLYHMVHANNKELHPIWLSLSLFSMYRNNSYYEETDQPLRVLANNLVNYHDLLFVLCRAEFAETGLEQRITERSLVILSTVPNVVVDFDGGIDQWQKVVNPTNNHTSHAVSSDHYRDAVDRAVTDITALFLAQYNERTRSEKAILFADDFCWVSDQPIGDWIKNALAEKMENTVLVVSRTTEILPGRQSDLYPLYLTNFTPEEVGFYFEHRLKEALTVRPQLMETFIPNLVENVYTSTNGHAQTVCLVADLLEYGDDGINIELPTFAPNDRTVAIRALARRMLESIRKPWLREALQLGALLRRFDSVMMYTLLSQNHETVMKQLGIEDMILTLEKFSFVDLYHDPRSGPYYAFHHFVADRIQEVIQEDDEAQQAQNPDYAPLFVELHTRIADYYKHQLEKYQEEEDESEDQADDEAIEQMTIVLWYRYEDPIWQQTMAEWLYHIAFVQDRERAQLEFVNQYFNAFLYWGFYIKFPFCEHLLTQWESTQHEDDEEIVGLLWRFHEAYPIGYSDEKLHADGWQIVYETIEKIDDYFGILKLDEDELGETRFTIRENLFEIYAGCCRYSKEPDYDRAIEFYEKIVTLSEGNDIFHESYARTYLAEMFIEMGEYERAHEYAHKSLEVLGSYRPFDHGQDYEVTSLNYRVLGDVDLVNEDYQGAAQNYLDATLCAYAFNFVQGDIPPDPYTAQWLHDKMRWITTKIIELVDAGNLSAAKLISTHLHQGWEIYWREMKVDTSDFDIDAILSAKDIEGLKAYLYPAPIDPDAPELEKPSYLQQMVDLVHTMLKVPDEA